MSILNRIRTQGVPLNPIKAADIAFNPPVVDGVVASRTGFSLYSQECLRQLGCSIGIPQHMLKTTVDSMRMVRAMRDEGLTFIDLEWSRPLDSKWIKQLIYSKRKHRRVLTPAEQQAATKAKRARRARTGRK